MKSIGMVLPENAVPRSPALWSKVFPYVHEEENDIKLIHVPTLTKEQVKSYFSIYDALIIGAPFKSQVARYVDTVGPAHTIGAVNFVHKVGPTTLLGYNTDYSGFIQSKPWTPENARTLVLGCGALGRTVLAALPGNTWKWCWNRTSAKAMKASMDFGGLWLNKQSNQIIELLPWFEWIIVAAPSPILGEFWRVTNLVHGKDAEELAKWQAAYAMNILYEGKPETYYGIMSA